MAAKPLDIERCKRAMENLHVSGVPDSPVRLTAIEDAITEIQADGEAALKDHYIGVKQYAAFGDQRADNEYGRKPYHGEIVFQIYRTPGNFETVLGSDEIYLIEAVRDAGTLQISCGGKDREWNLCDVIMQQRNTTRELLDLCEVLGKITVESHEEADHE